MNYFLEKLWCIASVVVIVVEEAREGEVVVAESKERTLVSTKTGEVMEECVPFGHAVVEAEEPLLFFLELDLLGAFGMEMDAETGEECVSFVDRLEEASVFFLLAVERHM